MFDYKRYLSVYACSAGYSWLSTTTNPLQAWLANNRYDWIMWIIYISEFKDMKVARRVIDLAVDMDVYKRPLANSDAAKKLREQADAADVVFNSSALAAQKVFRLSEILEAAHQVNSDGAPRLYQLYISELRAHVQSAGTNMLYNMLYHCSYRWRVTSTFTDMLKAIIPYDEIMRAVIDRAGRDYPDNLATFFDNKDD